MLAAGEEIFEIYMHISAFLQDGKWWGGSPFPGSKMVNGGGGHHFLTARWLMVGGVTIWWGGSPFPASKMVNGGGGHHFLGIYNKLFFSVNFYFPYIEATRLKARFTVAKRWVPK